jgi:uncharacterized Tic20 family protein
MATDPLPPTPLAPGLPTNEEKLWGMLAHVSALLMLASAVGQFIAPLVIYLIYKDKSKFIAFHALQSLYWQLAILLVGLVICGVGVVVTVPLGLIMAIVVGIKAYDGELYEYWVVGEWARRQVGV